jgi:hypothetical protein
MQHKTALQIFCSLRIMMQLCSNVNIENSSPANLTDSHHFFTPDGDTTFYFDADQNPAFHVMKLYLATVLGAQ